MKLNTQVYFQHKSCRVLEFLLFWLDDLWQLDFKSSPKNKGF